MSYSNRYPYTAAAVSPARETPVSMSHHQLRAKGIFDAGRAFELMDDLEFCPTLSEEEIQAARQTLQAGSSLPPTPSHQQQQQNMYAGYGTPYSTSPIHNTPPHANHDMATGYTLNSHMHHHQQHAQQQQQQQPPQQQQHGPLSRYYSPESHQIGLAPASSNPGMASHFPRMNGVIREQQRVMDMVVDPIYSGRVASPTPNAGPFVGYSVMQRF